MAASGLPKGFRAAKRHRRPPDKRLIAVALTLWHSSSTDRNKDFNSPPDPPCLSLQLVFARMTYASCSKMAYVCYVCVVYPASSRTQTQPQGPKKLNIPAATYHGHVGSSSAGGPWATPSRVGTGG
eukprot:scaffold61381_cov33-Tisochrysis_lutea.AAC.6